MDAASKLYSAEQPLRTCGRAQVDAALLAARERTLLLAHAYTDALELVSMRVPYARRSIFRSGTGSNARAAAITNGIGLRAMV